jgi:DNA-binding NtrC family response regulator
MKYDFPGNVRELENIIERAVVLCRGKMIGISDLPFKESLPPSKGSLKENLEELEYRMVAQALQSCDGHQVNAALQLGISERMLRYKLKKYGLK